MSTKISEAKRSYLYSNGAVLTIEKPVEAQIEEDNSHTIIDSEGVQHLVRDGWLSMQITPMKVTKEKGNKG